MPLQYQTTVLSAIGSLGGGRYNAAGSFEMYYLGENADTVARETRMMIRDEFGNFVAAQHRPTIMMTIDYNLQRVVDLTDTGVLKLLRVSARALLVEWKDVVKSGRVPTTQQLGQAAHDAGVEALVVPSRATLVPATSLLSRTIC